MDDIDLATQNFLSGLPTPAQYDTSGPISVWSSPASDSSGGFSFGAVTDLFASAAKAYTSVQNGLLQRDLFDAKVDIAKENAAATRYVSGNQAQIEKLRADYALTAAQQQLATARAYGVGSASQIAGFLSTGPLNTKNDFLTTAVLIGAAVLGWVAYHAKS